MKVTTMLRRGIVNGRSLKPLEVTLTGRWKLQGPIDSLDLFVEVTYTRNTKVVRDKLLFGFYKVTSETIETITVTDFVLDELIDILVEYPINICGSY